MYEWQKQIQMIVDEIDSCIKNYEDEALTPVSYTHLICNLPHPAALIHAEGTAVIAVSAGYAGIRPEL